MFKILKVGLLATVGAVLMSRVLIASVDTPPGVASKGQPANPSRAAVASPSTKAPQQSQPQAVSLSADDRGHFITEVKIDGMFVKGLVDTGASSIAIPADVARNIGIKVSSADRKVRLSTANGETDARMVTLNEVRISSIVVRNVEAVIVEKGLPITLIGMSFIRRVSSEMRGNTLVLRQ